jgi:hypothetical protein
VRGGDGHLAEQGLFFLVVVQQEALGGLEHEPLLLERLLNHEQQLVQHLHPPFIFNKPW